MAELIAERLSGRVLFWNSIDELFLKVLSPSQRSNANESGSATQQQVAYVLETNVRSEADNARLAMQVVRVDDGIQIWSDNYEIGTEADFQAQRFASNTVASAIRFLLFQNVLVRNAGEFEELDGVKPEALRLYFDSAGKPPALKIKLLSEATEIDPTFQLAYGLISLHSSFLPGIDWFSSALDANNKAIELRPDGALSWCSRGQIFSRIMDYENASKAFGKCMSLDSRHIGSGSVGLAKISLSGGRVDEAREHLVSALAMTEPQQFTRLEIARVLLAIGDYEQALVVAEETLQDGRVPDSRRQQAMAVKIFGLSVMGESGQVDRLVKDNPVIASRPYLRLILHGKTEDWLNHLELQVSGRDSGIYGIRVAPYLDHLRDEPRFIDVLKQLDALERSAEI